MILAMFQTTPPPSDLVTLQWIIILALASVVAFLYRQLVKTQDDHKKSNEAMQEKTLTGLGDFGLAIKDLADALEALREQLSLKKEIEELRREFRDAKKE